MSNDADNEYGPTPPGAGYEHTDIDPAVGYRFALWLGVAMLLSGALVYGVFLFLGSRAAGLDEAARTFPLGQGRSQDPPAPRLQTQPFKDIYQLKAEQLGALHSYGWVDQAKRRRAHPDRTGDGAHAAARPHRAAPAARRRPR